MTSLPGYDGWKTGGGMPHLEDRDNPYLSDDDAPCCWECGDHGAKAELVECRDRHWRCARCLAEVEGHDDDAD